MRAGFSARSRRRVPYGSDLASGATLPGGSREEDHRLAIDRIIGRTTWDRVRFVISVGMDVLGSSSYLGYLLGPGAAATEGSDVAFAPIQSLYLLLAYHRWDSIPAAIGGGIEELLPGTDIIPSCTMYHIYVMRQRYAEEPQQPQLPAATPAK